MRRRSRSRSRRGQGRGPAPERKDSTSARLSPREQAEAEARQLERRLRGEAPAEQRRAASGQDRAREAVEREREKARLKKQGRDQDNKDRANNKERDKVRKREALSGDVDKELEKARAQAMAEQLDEGLTRKLFGLLDRAGKGQVSQRDVLIALRKQPPVRRLFGLPVTNLEEGGSALEARLLAIQDSFEAGSGLGELGPAFEKLRALSEGQAFGWDAFLQGCGEEPMRARAVAAASLLPREHSTGAAFVATQSWTVVPEGAACPSGLEYKMDMESGRTMARLMPTKPAARGGARGKVSPEVQTLACK